MASGKLTKLYDSDIPTTGLSISTNDTSNSVNTALKYMAAFRWDITNLETFDETIPAGTVAYVRNRTGYPTSAYNYSPGIYFKPSVSESLWIMFGRTTNDIVIKAKSSDVWESGWHYINSTP